jgi:hypothetical protein
MRRFNASSSSSTSSSHVETIDDGGDAGGCMEVSDASSDDSNQFAGTASAATTPSSCLSGTVDAELAFDIAEREQCHSYNSSPFCVV